VLRRLALTIPIFADETVAVAALKKEVIRLLASRVPVCRLTVDNEESVAF